MNVRFKEIINKNYNNGKNKQKNFDQFSLNELNVPFDHSSSLEHKNKMAYM